MMCCSLICFGNGNWTIRPSVVGSSFTSLILSISSPSRTVSGNRIRLLSKPASPLVVILDFTYDSLGACSPTRMMVMCGLRRPDST